MLCCIEDASEKWRHVSFLFAPTVHPSLSLSPNLSLSLSLSLFSPLPLFSLLFVSYMLTPIFLLTLSATSHRLRSNSTLRPTVSGVSLRSPAPLPPSIC